MTSRLSITTDSDWLKNDHAGEMLVSEFMEPLNLSIERMAGLVKVTPERLRSVIDGSCPMDAELDLRLGRYFGMTEGFFLRLQAQYALLEAKRALNGELESIVPRAA